MTKSDYSKMDSKRRYHHRSEYLVAAKRLGYDYISEGIIKEYRKLKSTQLVAELFGVTGPAILALLQKFGEPIAKRRVWRKNNEN